MASKPPIFITRIGTDAAKLLCQLWFLVEKIKRGLLEACTMRRPPEDNDTQKVHTRNQYCFDVSSRAYRLTQPYSPHKSAAIDGIIIMQEKFILPATDNTLIVEGAGGLMVPLNNQFLMIDLIKQLKADDTGFAKLPGQH